MLTHPDACSQLTFGENWRESLVSPELSLEIAAHATLLNSSRDPGNATPNENITESHWKLDAIALKAESPSPTRKRARSAPPSTKPTPESFEKHTQTVDTSPASSQYGPVARTLFPNIDGSSFTSHDVSNESTHQDKIKPKRSDEPHVENEGTENESAKSHNIGADVPLSQSTQGMEIDAEQQTTKTSDNNQRDGFTNQDCNNVDDFVALTAENEKLQCRNTQMKTAYDELHDIFGTEFSQFKEEKEGLESQVRSLEAERDEGAKLRKSNAGFEANFDELTNPSEENQDLKTEYNKYTNPITHLNRNVNGGQWALKQVRPLNKKVESSKRVLKRAEQDLTENEDLTDAAKTHLDSTIKPKIEIHKAEMLKLKEQHEEQVARLKQEAKTEREASEQKMEDLKATIKDLKANIATEEKNFELAIESAETTHKNEFEDLNEEQADTLKWTKKEHQDKLDQEKAALQTCRDLKKSLQGKLAETEQALSTVQNDLALKEDENAQLWEAIRLGKEDWKVERARIYKARIQIAVDLRVAETVIESLREDEEVDPVRKSQWKKLIENKDDMYKRLQQRNGKLQEEVYKLQVTVRISKEKAKDERESLVSELVMSKGLVQELLKHREDFRKISKKMLEMLTGKTEFQTVDALGTIVKRAEVLEQDNWSLLTRNDVCDDRFIDSQKLLVDARREIIDLKQELEDKTAAFESLQDINSILEGEKLSLQRWIDVEVPKERTEAIATRDARVKDLELSAAKQRQRIRLLVKLKADEGFQQILQEKDKIIVKLTGQYDRLCADHNSLQAQHDALLNNEAYSQQYFDRKEDAHERDIRRAEVAEMELYRLRFELVKGNEELADPTKWQNWLQWKHAVLEAQAKQGEAERTAQRALAKVDGLSQLTALLWRRIFGFEHLLAPSLCPARLSETRGELVHLTSRWLDLNINESMGGDEAAIFDATEIQNTGTYRGPRGAPREWKLAGARMSKAYNSMARTSSEGSASALGIDMGYVRCVVQEVLDQWTRKADFLKAALWNVPAQPIADTPCTYGMALAPQLYGMTQLYGDLQVQDTTSPGNESSYGSEDEEADFF